MREWFHLEGDVAFERGSGRSVSSVSMAALKKVPSEGGSGGKRGHSAMEHAFHTEEIKDAARVARRRDDRSEVDAQLAETADGPNQSQSTRDHT